MMTGNELRRAYLSFFEQRGHKVCASDALVPPADDKSLLFTGAGMNQFKDQFLGRVPLTFTRATTSQKCLRTGDIPNVGVTSFHQTFFEMLGNFSFGDYFKREAITWAWELSTETLKLAADHIHISVHRDDDESAQIWQKEVGIAENRFWRFGDKDNFWPANAPTDGPNGPCGPCSELFWDWGRDVGCRKDGCNPSCSCGRFVEYWNLVFTQYDRKEGGRLDPLPQKNIDTGAGMERLLAIVQGKRTSYDTDLFRPIVAAVCEITGKPYDPKAPETRLIRRISDHARAAAFCVGDGVLPSNQGRGYVLRKLIRQAVRDAHKLGRDGVILCDLAPVVAGVMREQYPDVEQRIVNIARIIRGEEERFLETLKQGSGILDELIARMKSEQRDVLPGDEAFRLFDTYGFPLDVAEGILEESGVKIDREGFERAMEEQRRRARGATKIAADIFGAGPLVELKTRGANTAFLGYDAPSVEARVVGIVCGEDLVQHVDEGEEALVVLDRTSFYGESGGQVGDAGVLRGEEFEFQVEDARRGEGMVLHVGRVTRGRLRQEDVVCAEVDLGRRLAVERNHTATHLLHHALREVLGQHAEQSGSLVAAERLRFDFTHSEALTPEQLAAVETRVNEKILADAPVSTEITDLNAARQAGAMALFGEKYGEEVRMVSVGQPDAAFSRELCGGCHVRRTGEIGQCRIVAEQSVAAGIRRIEAVTGLAALEEARGKDAVVRRLCHLLKAQEPKLLERVEALQDQIKELKAEVRKARESGGAAGAAGQTREVKGVRVVTSEVEGADAGTLRTLADQQRQPGNTVAMLAAKGGKGVALIVAVSKDLTAKGVDAVKLAKAAASVLGGGGGGRPDLAQAGGQHADQIPAAFDKAAAELEGMLG